MLTMKQVEAAVNHLQREYPGFMSSSERDDYLDAVSYLEPGEMSQALSKLPIDRRPSPEELLQTALESRPGLRPGKPDPNYVLGVIERSRRSLDRVRDAV